MKVDRDTWMRANVIYNEYLRLEHTPISRAKLSNLLGVSDRLAGNILFAIENKNILKFDPEIFSTSHSTVELCFGDVHIPFQDDLAIQTMFGYLEENNIIPNIIIILGDLIDFYKISSFVKDPKKKSVKEEIDLAKKFLYDLREYFPDSKIVYKNGNHECVTWDTEILTKDGWKLANDITQDDDVAQFNLDTGVISFAKPIKISKYDVDKTVTVKTNQGLEKVTLNHSLVVDNKRVKVSDIMQNGFTQLQQRFAGDLAIEYRGKLNYSDDYLRLLTWVIMDGTWWIASEGKTEKDRVFKKTFKEIKYSIYV